MNNELSIKKETFSNETFGNFITTAKNNLNSLARKANDTFKFNAYYINYFDNVKNIDGALAEDWKRHNVNNLKDYVSKELNIGKSQYYNLLAVGKLLELDEKGNPKYTDERLEHFNVTAVGLLINKCPENENFSDYIERLFSSGRITTKMSNNEIRTALKDKVMAEDKKTTKKVDKKEDTNEEPIDTLKRIAIDFEDFYCKVVGTEFKNTHEVDLNTLHRIFEKYANDNPFEENK